MGILNKIKDVLRRYDISDINRILNMTNYEWHQRKTVELERNINILNTLLVGRRIVNEKVCIIHVTNNISKVVVYNQEDVIISEFFCTREDANNAVKIEGINVDNIIKLDFIEDENKTRVTKEDCKSCLSDTSNVYDESKYGHVAMYSFVDITKSDIILFCDFAVKVIFYPITGEISFSRFILSDIDDMTVELALEYFDFTYHKGPSDYMFAKPTKEFVDKCVANAKTELNVERLTPEVIQSVVNTAVKKLIDIYNNN